MTSDKLKSLNLFVRGAFVFVPLLSYFAIKKKVFPAESRAFIFIVSEGYRRSANLSPAVRQYEEIFFFLLKDAQPAK